MELMNENPNFFEVGYVLAFTGRQILSPGKK
jgi:hypothetical protein